LSASTTSPRRNRAPGSASGVVPPPPSPPFFPTRLEASNESSAPALLDARTPTPDLVVYLTADREILRSRVRRLVSSSDRMIKLNVIERLAAEMDEHFFSYESGPLLVINTSEYDFVERPAELGEFIELIEKTRAGVHHYRPMQTSR
jgi:hypothetical protein